MPLPTGQVSPAIPPKLLVSSPSEDLAEPLAHPTLASRQRSKTESAALKGAGRQGATEWVDADEPSQTRKKSSRRSTRRASESSGGTQRSRRHTESGVERFLPKLSRISESSESRTTSRPGTSGSDSRKSSAKGSPRKKRHRDDVAAGHRRPVKHRVGGVSRKSGSDPPFRANPSLLSVLSSLTRTSDRSSSSNNTITQLSYDRKESACSKETSDLQRSETDPKVTRSSSPSVFDYMDATSAEAGHDGHPIMYSSYSSSSSASSQYEPSEAGSSEVSGTPSSQSTFPSPTATRNSSISSNVAELRRKYDAQSAAPTTARVSPRRGSTSPKTSAWELHRMSHTHGGRGNGGLKSPSEVSYDDNASPESPPVPVRPNVDTEDELRYQEDALRRHLALLESGHHPVEPVYGQHRSHSTSSHGSDGSARAYAQYMAMQQYQHPSPPSRMAYPVPPQATNGYAAHPDRPPVPDAPDLSQRTVVGYEQLALELANDDSHVKPLYRKFAYLNHRILLHMQDELCEMEEQLRTIDEIIAQMEHMPKDGQPPPASRRGDAFNGTEMHHRRTALLGRIFLKTEQYSRAMSSFASMKKDSQSAEPQHVAAYQDWLSKKSPIHEVETRFLQRPNDLILPGSAKQTSETVYRPTEHAALTCVPVALLLLLFAIIPNLVGRLFVLALIAVGVGVVAATTTSVRSLVPVREGAVCAAVGVLVMVAVAGWVPLGAG